MLSKFQNLKWPGKDKSDTKARTDSNSAASSDATSAESPSAGKGTAAQLEDKLSNTSEKIRTAAVLELRDTGRLLEISKSDASNNIQLIAARQYAKLLPTDPTTKQALETYAASADTRHLARLITAHQSDSEIRQLGLTQFTTDEDFLDIALETRFHDTRMTVTRKIQSLDIIDKCWRQIKSKDKIVARELKQKLTEQQDKLEQQKTQQERVLKITSEMEKLATGAWSPTLSNRYDLFAKMWTDLDFEVATEQQQVFETYRKTAFEKVSENLSTQKYHDDCQVIIESLEKIPPQFKAATLETLADLVATLKPVSTELNRQWQSLNDQSINPQHQTDSKLLQRFTAAKTKADSALDHAGSTLDAHNELQKTEDASPQQLKKQLKSLQQLESNFEKSDNTPQYAQELPQLGKSIQETLRRRTEETKDLKVSINKQFGSLNSAISSNRWGPAKSIHERLQKKLNRLEGGDRKQYSEKLERLEKKLNDLGDWKQFATEPKLTSLCEQMEKVPSLGLTPKEQADRIKDLQTQWKSMGANPAQETHWPRFKAAADIAYEPCAKYFAAKRDEKKSKLAKRTEICDLLQTYIDKSDWENPDSKLVEKTIRTAKTEWRNTRVFDRKAGAKLEERFTVLLATLNEKLAPAYEAAVQEKTDLIEKVKTLGEGEINQHCINQVKRLQSMWRVTATTKRADDQKLWTEFNEACSIIYNSHRGKQKEQYAASVEHVTRAKQIISELKAITNSANQIDEKVIEQLQDEFQGLAEFPEKEQKYLFRDYNRAVEGVEKHRHKVAESAQQQEIQRLHHNATICEQLEALVGNAPDTISTDLDTILADWNEGEKTDKPRWKKAMNLRKDSIVAHLQAGTQPDFESDTMARRLLCIQSEILHEKETPTEDKQLRMQHQLEQLQQGMSNTTASTLQEQSAELQFRWLTMYPAHPELREKLNTRFNSTNKN